MKSTPNAANCNKLDLNFMVELGANKFTLENAFYELIANAYDTSTPVDISNTENEIVIADNGPGVSLKAFTLGPSKDGNPKLFGANGIGLKDAIAAIMREVN